MRLSVRESVLAAVCYADVFDFPLTEEEVAVWGVGRSIPLSRVRNVIDKLCDGQADRKSPQAVFLKGRQGILKKRRERSAASRKKYFLAKKASLLYSFIPSIDLVGVTGGVAVSNAGPEDDIDLLFIVRDGTLWVSRFLVTIVTELFTRRRRPETTDLADTFCLNMFLTEASLGIPETERDLYTAHEVLSMLPLWEREGTYGQFLSRNAWVRTFFPSAWTERMNDLEAEVRGWKTYPQPDSPLTRGYSRGTDLVFRSLEPAFRAFQKFYMRKRVTREVITESVIRFHPMDMRGFVRRELKKRLTVQNIPLDKVFYGRLK